MINTYSKMWYYITQDRCDMLHNDYCLCNHYFASANHCIQIFFLIHCKCFDLSVSQPLQLHWIQSLDFFGSD